MGELVPRASRWPFPLLGENGVLDSPRICTKVLSGLAPFYPLFLSCPLDGEASALIAVQLSGRSAEMFKTNPILLKDLLNDVEACRIMLPDFQRGWVWGDDRIRGLLASISRGFPIGAVMMLKSGGDIRFKSRPVEGIPNKAVIEPEDFLLDGQQRLTSLYQALRHDGPVATYDSRGGQIERWYYIDMDLAPHFRTGLTANFG